MHGESLKFFYFRQALDRDAAALRHFLSENFRGKVSKIIKFLCVVLKPEGPTFSYQDLC